jgi:hypothetical protein
VSNYMCDHRNPERGPMFQVGSEKEMNKIFCMLYTIKIPSYGKTWTGTWRLDAWRQFSIVKSCGVPTFVSVDSESCVGVRTTGVATFSVGLPASYRIQLKHDRKITHDSYGYNYL